MSKAQILINTYGRKITQNLNFESYLRIIALSF
jgi:hypothetical protein